ncbi:Tic22-like family protein [Nitzschia inconspicua]|uniref:Tic22-like family protein n=1 Tax=Nitzschia inconspicua TaxID=303405 RepID=A0A9K3PGM4_9STRA|nr:Tic22-like family protein [Nitzschia inconspicua]
MFPNPSPATTDAAAVETTATTNSNNQAEQPPAPSSTTSSLVSVEDIAALLHSTPTFCLVDPNGVPFMVVGEDAKVTGYFFTSFGEAQRILQLAKTSAEKAIRQAKREGLEDDSNNMVADNPWRNARISTVPLDTAVTLVYKSSRTKGVYFKVAPAVQDVQDALLVSGQGGDDDDNDLAEGKVPLFYYEDFQDSNGKSPLFFRKRELEQAWDKANPPKQRQLQQERPPLMVTELFSVLGELGRPTTGNIKEDEELRNLILQPPKESQAKAKECLKKGGDAPAFVIGQRIIVL